MDVMAQRPGYDETVEPSSTVLSSPSQRPRILWNSSKYARYIEKKEYFKPTHDSYAGLGTLMNQNTDVAIVRRFGSLNAQNLLYLQAELVILEKKLRQQEYFDRRFGSESEKDFYRDYNTLSDNRESEQYMLILQIREKLKEYST